ncbi:MAG: DUF3284 domain-containing protein [Streptococcaceae bacterium]|jgi:hypothetical protein|nr:DUF3284 domain-containing protein [Streptococcaceae bacterium]
MEIRRTLNAPASFIYGKMVDSAVFDIRQQTGKTLKHDQLTGFEYVKQFSASRRAKIKILEAKKDEKYSFKTTTSRNAYITTYSLQAIDEKHCEVIFEEKIESFGLLQQVNDALVSIPLSFSKKRQLRDMFDALAKEYTG